MTFNVPTLRDYFAGQALVGLLAADSPNDVNGDARAAYLVADAMLAARTPPPTECLPPTVPLLGELRETADWLDGIAREVEAVGPVRKGGEAEARLSALVAKLRGRAFLIRQTIQQTQGV